MLDQAIGYLTELLKSNEFFQGGFILSLLGAIVVWGRQIPTKAWALIKRLLIVECDIQQRDMAFKALVAWLAAQPYGKRVKRFSISVLEDSEGLYNTVFSPAPGVHWLWYERRVIRLSRGREKLTIGDGDAIAGFYESFTLQTFGRSRAHLERLIKTVVKAHTDRGSNMVSVRVQDGYGGWDELNQIPARSMDSVVLDGGIAEQTLEDMRRFIRSEEWYTSLGIPYRRGYLFSGPPGTGKSSFCMALASRLNFGLSIVTLSDRKLTDVTLAKMLAGTRRRSLLLLEDIDCLFEEDRSSKDAAEGVTLSGLLNALDGAQAQTGRLVVMTTNYPEVLDPALTRPGRADVRIEFKLASLGQIERLFLRFFPEAHLGEAESFSKSVGDGKKSVAEVQELLIGLVDDKKTTITEA